jgi:cation diffusion facilitator family transporter
LCKGGFSGWLGAYAVSAGHVELVKQRAALSSVVAAVFLTTFKLVVGLLSGSLGILAEAAHSGLDLAAAAITFFAVRASSKPPDREHLYGHGKLENLSALSETGLLVGTCVWIIVEAVHRLTGKHAEVSASIWTFLVMAVSIVVDVSRSRMLYRVARTYRSQALEADAMHFQTDIWSSVVVLFGLAGVRLSAGRAELAFLQGADAVAALIVALLVLWVCSRLGLRTAEGLLDQAPVGKAEAIKAKVEAIRNVVDCHAVRIRSSGPHDFVDLHVLLDGSLTLTAAHDLTEKIEQAVQDIVPGADVTVHPEPTAQTPSAPGQPQA